MATKIFYSKAPTRIDLAGGTVDIWPVYLMLKNPITLNLGISLFAEAKIEISPVKSNESAKVVLKSEDQKIELKLSWNDLKDPLLLSPQNFKNEGKVKIPSVLELHFKLLKFFIQNRLANHWDHLESIHFTLSTHAQSPAGAGLGGSSALSVAIIGGLASWIADLHQQRPIDPEIDGEKFIDIVRDIETTVIRVPAGLQDYYGAMFGGLQSLYWGIGSHRKKKLPEYLIKELNERILLFYSGHSRNSGINNWALFKSMIDQQGGVREKFEKITAITAQLEKAFEAGRFTEVGQTIHEEWEVRKTLADGITTPEIDRAFKQAKKLAPVSGKVCGAGGGGCFFVYLPIDAGKERDELRAQIQTLFTEQGIQSLPFQGVRQGLEVQVSCA